MSVTRPVAVLGRAAQLPAPITRIADDPELGGLVDDAFAATPVRSLSGRLQAPEGMSRWARLDRYGKAVVAVCDRAYDRRLGSDGPETGLYVASLHSCLETNTAFDQGMLDKGPRLASPLLFPYTLPGSTASEAAMLLGLTGAYLVFPGDDAAALIALVAAIDALRAGEAERLLVVAADVLGPATLAWLARDPRPSTAPPLAEAAAAIWLGREGDGMPAPRRHIEAVLGPGSPGANGYAAMVRDCLARCGASASQLSEVISTTVDEAEHRAQEEALTAVVPHSIPLELGWTTGDAGAPLGLLAVQAALDEEEPRLILAGGRAGSVALMVC